MKHRFLACWALLLGTAGLYAQHPNAQKEQALTSIGEMENELITLSDDIWAAAEIAFQEEKSSDPAARQNQRQARSTLPERAWCGLSRGL